MELETDDLGELACNVFALEKIKSDQDHESSVSSCGTFSIHVYASFMPPINESECEEDESDIFDVECDIVEKTFLVEREKLLRQETSAETVSEILDTINVPVDSFIIDKILDCARKTGSDKEYRLNVQIYVPPSSRFQEAMDTDDDNGSNVDDVEFEPRLVPTTKASVEALEKIIVEDSRNCAICLDEVPTGSEATRMPCLHVFHSPCILNWLDKRGTCPLCRNQIS